jgi:hypothetical protein
MSIDEKAFTAEPVAWRYRFGDDDEWCVCLPKPHGTMPWGNDYREEPLYTATPDTAQAVAAEREACAKLLDDAATTLDQTGALKAAVQRLFKLADDMRARGAKP